MQARGRTKRAMAVSHVLLTVYALIVLVPMLFIVYLSFKDLTGILAHPMAPPSSPQIGNYGGAWTGGDLGRYLINTVVVALSTIILIVIVSSMAAFVIARYEFHGNQALYLFFLAGLALPIQLIALPIFILMRQLNLLNNLLALILVYSAGGISFSVFLLVNFMRSIPKDLEEAAYIDGANAFQVYWHVIMPLIRPALSIVAIFEFVVAWKEFFFPLILISDKKFMTVAVGVLSFVGEHGTAWQLLLPGLVIVSLPTVLGFLLVARQFRRNMMRGAVKL